MSLLPLRGLRVLDFTRVLAGPWCTMLLGDQGAEVIKLERPGLGDDTRSWAPPFVGDGEAKLSAYFLSVNRNKKSIAVDMTTEAGLNVCRRLAIEWADVLVENFKVGTLEKRGLDYDNLSRDNPGLVFCSITGFGPTGPLAQSPGYDVIVSGMYGLLSITGSEEEPAKTGVASTDILTGTLANSGILSALYERQQTGYGKKIDVSLMETSLAGLVNIGSNVLNAREGALEPRRWGTAHESIVPYQAFRCKHEKHTEEVPYILVGAGNDVQFSKLCEVLGIPKVAGDERFSTNAARVENRHILVSQLEDIFQTKSREEWWKVLQGQGFPLGPMRSVSEAFRCKQAVHRGMVEESNHPHLGTIRLPRSPISFSSSSGSGDGAIVDEKPPVLPPPMLGEHTEEVLNDILHICRDDLLSMEELGAIQCWRSHTKN